jgi:two-component system, chemotaxis family, sensor kinase CheA
VTLFSDERGAELRQLFFETAQELLQALNEGALNLEKHPGDLETVRGIRRTVHTLKGDAAACGFHELSELAHELEDALAREHTASPVSLADVAFTAADAFEALLVSYRGNLAPPSAEPLRKLIRELAQDAKPQAPSAQKKETAARAAWSEPERLLIQNALRQGKRVYQIAIHLDPLCTMPIAARQLALNAFSGIGQVLAAQPESSLPQSTRHLLFVLTTEQSSEQIAARCRIPTVTTGATVEEILAGETASSTPAAEGENAEGSLPAHAGGAAAASGGADSGQKSPSSAASAENTLRVDAKRIDSVLNLVGELIIGKSMLQQILVEFTRRHPKDALRARLADSLAFQSRVLNDLQHSVMKVRMVPVEQLFRRFPRLVRDIARQCGKQAQLAISGQDTDLDRSLLDAIAEPLTHLIRNAVSHGIEPAEERVRAHKPACGTIRLQAYHEGNQVVVEVGDDGLGIDLQRVKAKAIEQQLLTIEQSGALSEAEILELLFRPGFSTAPQVNEISGRGVGLDVVRSVLQRLKGTVEIVNRPGRGTTFRLKLPLTLAIIKALLFRVEGRLYAIPLNAVDRIARASESDLHRVDGHEVLQLRGQALQLVRLGRVRADIAKYPHTRIFILVIASGDRQLGLIVDALEGEEELVIKAMDDHTMDTDLVSGASILGDGRVVLILNLAAVVERSNRTGADAAGEFASGILLLHAERAAHSATATGGQQ